VSRLRRRDRALLLILLPLWAACFALFVRERLADRPTRPTLLVASPPGSDALPRVVRYRPGFAQPEEALRPGDELVRIGTVDARGLSAFSVLAHSLAEADAAGRFEVAYRRGDAIGAAQVGLLREGSPWRTSAGAFGFAVIAVLLIRRAPGSRAAQRFLPAALVWSLCWIEFQGASVLQTYAYLAVRAAAGSLWAPLMILAVRELPERVEPRAPARWPWLFALLGPTWTSMWFGWPLPIDVGTRLNPALGGLAIVALLAVLTRNYRQADTAGRRQLEWVMLGGYLGGLPVLLGVAAAALDPERVWLWNWSLTALVLIPVSWFIAITRSNLLDIDRLISSTATYSLLASLLLGAALTALPPLAALVSGWLGLERSTVHLAFAGVLAPFVVLAEQRLRPVLERVLFSERQALKLGAAGLVAELAAAPDAERLLASAGARLEALLRPACCAIYGRAGRAYAPVFVHGVALAPAFAAESPLLAALRRGGALDLGEARAALSDPADRGAIGSLGAVALVPIAHGAELTGFVALGPKASGDVYTATDRALLSAIGSALATSLARLGEKELLREARVREERLSRYVPAAFASELSRGPAPDAGEREVTVLFADLRSYSRSAHGRAPEEVFAAVSRYTQIVTGPVVRHGGTVVEFAGDGIMAVFGAPDPLAEKERAAVLAALEIVESMRGVELFPGAARDEAPPMGIGIATGLAFVGTIHSFDRDIWSAIGSTTNLASRLQSLTRDLDAWIAIDDASRERAGDAAAPFHPRSRMAIRGLPERLTIWSL
jgi:class 3 adenylate cyclase